MPAKDNADKRIRELLERKLHGAMGLIVQDIVKELPKGSGSSIADKIMVRKAEKNASGNTRVQVLANQVWVWLNDGTGIYSDKHKGMGPNGEIVPIYSKYLHFKNRVIAAALGFPDENVFLKKVKGITPRLFWDRHFRIQNIQEKMQKVK